MDCWHHDAASAAAEPFWLRCVCVRLLTKFVRARNEIPNLIRFKGARSIQVDNLRMCYGKKRTLT